MSIYRPANQAEAAIWNRISPFVFDGLIPHIRHWPFGFRRAIQAGGQLNNAERFALFVFLYGNGVSPQHSAETVRRVLGPYLTPHREYHIQAMLRAARADAIPGHYTYWDVSRRRSTRLDGRAA